MPDTSESQSTGSATESATGRGPAGTIAWLAFGSNVGDRRATIESACEALRSHTEVTVLAVASMQETAPVGPVRQRPFVNTAARVRVTASPRRLLEICQSIERDHGRAREREQRWGPRRLDIDILLYGDLSIDEPGLTIPHPRMHDRMFVLRPIAEIDPELMHPTTGRSVQSLLEASRLDHHEASPVGRDGPPPTPNRAECS